MAPTPPAPTAATKAPARVAYVKPRRPISRVFLHCSASDNPKHDDVSVMTTWHKERGFNTVGYHFFITKAGVIQPGRSLEIAPAAQVGHNTGTIAICLHGLDAARFTLAQFAALRTLCSDVEAAHGAGRLTYHGHREVAAKVCPVFDYRAVLKLDKFGRLGQQATAADRIATNLRQDWAVRQAA